MDRRRMGAILAVVRRRAAGRLDVVCATVWSSVYLSVWVTGGRIDATDAVTSWQLAPLDVLERAPLETLWYLHTQPPGWNALVAVLVRFSPLDLASSFHMLMLVSGILLCLAVFRISSVLGAPPRVACGLTMVATLNSQIIDSGFTVLYDLPLAALLAWVVALVGSSPSRRTLVVATLAATVVTMSRSLYHPIWLLAVVALVALRFRSAVSRRMIAAAVLVPLAVAGGWMSKNAVQHGEFTLSSWTGMNLLRSVAPAVSSADIAQLRENGEISDVAVVGYFMPYSSYEPFVPQCSPRADIDVLARPLKSDAAVAGPFGPYTPENFNFDCYLDIYSTARSDAIALVVHHPGDWLEARSWAINNWLTTVDSDLDGPVVGVLDAATRIAFLAVPHPGSTDASAERAFWLQIRPLSLTLGVLTVVAMWAGSRHLRDAFRRRASIDPAAAVTIVAVVTIAWTMMVGIGFELGEQSRFRAVIDPLAIAVGGAVVFRSLRGTNGGIRR